MKALVWTDINQLEIKNMDDPKPCAGEVLIRVACVGICGSDLHIWHGDHPRAKPPLIMGHEFVGTIAEVGPDVEGWSSGDPVAVYPVIGCGECAVCRDHGEHICGKLGLYGIDWNGGMAEYVKVRADKLHRLPAETDLTRAALIEPIAVGVHTMSLCGFKPGATAAIIGAGPIGVSVGMCAKQAGAKQVIIGDVSDFRLDVARKVGLETVNVKERNFAEVVRERTDGTGAEFVFEATGIPAAATNMLDPVAIAGMLVVVGIFPGAIPVDLRTVAFKELRMVGVRMYSPAEFSRAVELVCSGEIDVSPLITDVYPLERGVEAFDRTAAGGDNIKILISCS